MGTQVAPDRATEPSGSDDPVLAGALSEMSSDGFEASKTLGDLETKGAAASQGDQVDAAKAAVPAKPTGDAGESDGSEVVAPASEAKPEDDPLAGTEPFTYGDAKTAVDGVYRVPGEGLMVPEEHVAALTQRFERADQLERAHRDLTTQHATLDRLSTWTSKDANGKDVTLTGQDGLAAQRVAFAQQGAALSLLSAVFQPDKNGEYPLLLELLTTELVPDGKGGSRERVTLNPAALDALLTKSELAETRAEQKMRADIAGLLQPPKAEPAPINFATEGPRLIGEVAKAAKLDDKLLTPKQRETLTAQLRFHVTDGKVSPEWQALVRTTIEERAEATQAATAAEKAGKHNAGMDKGRQPAKAQAKPPTAPPKSDPKAGERKKPDWDGPLASALQEMAIER